MLSCHDVAKYILSLSDEDAGDLISNLKIQKLVYYVQGFHLAIYDKPLFPEAIEAWIRGPVVPVLFHAYEKHGLEPIPRPENIDFSIYTSEEKELIDDIYAVYGQFSAWKLQSMTREEEPWNEFNMGEIKLLDIAD